MYSVTRALSTVLKSVVYGAVKMHTCGRYGGHNANDSVSLLLNYDIPMYSIYRLGSIFVGYLYLQVSCPLFNIAVDNGTLAFLCVECQYISYISCL